MSHKLIDSANAFIANLQAYQPGKPIEELKKEFGLKDIVKLASNENPLGAGKKALAALSSVRNLGRYPDGNGHDLKEILAEHHSVLPEQIALGNGSNEILELVARCFGGANKQVVFSEHAFAVYPLVTQAVGAEAVVVPTSDWGHDPEAMQAMVTENTRLMFIANPNNPTGTWLGQEALRALLESLPEYMLAVVDEAYFDYVQEENYPNCIDWVNDFPNLLVTRTFSKVHGLAGLRIGYGVSNVAVTALLNQVRQPFNVNSLALKVAEAALFDAAHIEESLHVNQAGMKQLTEVFDDMGLEFIPSVGNFICVNLQQPGRDICNKLLHEGVIVRPIASYGMPNFLRVTIGKMNENEKFIQALRRVLN